MEFPNYLKNIQDNRKSIIDYYVKQFGKDTRSMFEERFDRIKFCFFVNPDNLKNYINISFLKEGLEEMLVFLEEMGFSKDNLIIDETLGRVSSLDKAVDKKIKALFPYELVILPFDNIDVEGIWCFRTDEEFLDYVKTIVDSVNSFGKYSTTSQSYLLERKCRFLKSLGLFPEDASNEEIINSPHFEGLDSYYQSLSNLALSHMEKAKGKFKELISFYNDLTSEINDMTVDLMRKAIKNSFFDMLSDEDKSIVGADLLFDPKKLSIYPLLFDKNINGGYIEAFSDDNSDLLMSSNSEIAREDIWIKRINYLKLNNFDFSNFENIKNDLLNNDWYEVSEVKDFLPSKELVKYVILEKEKIYEEFIKQISKICVACGNYTNDIDFDLTEIVGNHFNDTFVSDGKVKDITIYFGLFASFPNAEDIDLRHEIRHAMTTTAKLISEDVQEIKVGNKVELWQDDVMLEQRLSDYNEYVTQCEALRETEESFRNGVYLITPIGSIFPQEYTSEYDEYLPHFEMIYTKLPESSKRSQIEDTNDSLYSVIDEEKLMYYESLIKRMDMNLLDDISISEIGRRL